MEFLGWLYPLIIALSLDDIDDLLDVGIEGATCERVGLVVRISRC